MCEDYDDFYDEYDEIETEYDEMEYEKCDLLNNRCISYRRHTKIKNDVRLRKIINYYGYAPHIGWIDDNHIKRSGRSNCQRWMKRQTSKRARKMDIPNGNGYRKVFDYWWTLY